MPRGAVNGLWDVLEDEVEEDLVLFVSVRVEECSQIYDVWVLDNAHDLELSVFEALVLEHFFDGDVLLVLPRCTSSSALILASASSLHEVPISTRYDTCLKDDTKRTISDDLAVGVGQFA